MQPDINCVKDAKKQDVLKHLNELGVHQNVLDFYENALSEAGVQDEAVQNLEDSDEDVDQDRTY